MPIVSSHREDRDTTKAGVAGDGGADVAKPETSRTIIRKSNERTSSDMSESEKFLKRQGWDTEEFKKKREKRNQELEERIAKKRKIDKYSEELKHVEFMPDKTEIISQLYDIKDPKSWYWKDYGHWFQEWKDDGVMDPNGNILELGFLQGLQSIAGSLYMKDVWGVRTRAKLARIRSDVTHFIQLTSDKEMKSDTLQMVPIIKEHRQTLLSMLDYMRDIFVENLEVSESVDYAKNIYYPVKRAVEMPDYKIACKFLLEPLLSLIRKKNQTLERRFINLLIYESNSAQDVESRSYVAGSLVKLHCDFRMLGKQIAHEHDCLMLLAEEKSEDVSHKQDLHDLAFTFYTAIIRKEQELNKLGDKLNAMTERDTEFNLLMDADKIKESFFLASDEKYDFQMHPVANIRELHDMVLDKPLSPRRGECYEFMEYVYALEILSKGGMDVYRHPLLQEKGNNR